MTVVKVALAMDESKMFEKVPLTIELKSDSFNSFSAYNNFVTSLSATIAIMLLFLVVLYFVVPGMKSTVFVLFSKPNNEVMDK